MSERSVAVGALLVAVAAAVAFFLSQYERTDVEEQTSPSIEAMRNPLLAADRLLTSLGYDVSIRENLATSLELPPPDATAILRGGYSSIPDGELDPLLNWVADGGHLIVEIETLWEGAVDPIFTPLDVSVIERPWPDSDEAAAEAIGPNPAETPDRAYLGDMALDNHKSIKLGATPAERVIHDQFGVFAARLAYGEGRVTAVADLSFIVNRRIGQQDHAFLLTSSLAPAEQSGPVWMISNARFPSLLALLTDRIAPVMALAGLTLLLTLWGTTQRFGPLMSAPGQARRAFIEHVEATGRFLWRHQTGAGLLKETRSALLADARRRHPPLRRGTTDKHVFVTTTRNHAAPASTPTSRRCIG
ncbi:MAG: DUF4350 domain-containing protein [Pseudomonadota bacterium]